MGWSKRKALLDALIKNAKKGAIIPVRLPTQLEEIAALMQQAQTDAAASIAAASAVRAAHAGDENLVEEQAAFFGHAIHELRTPMTSIRGYSDMMVNPSMGTLADMQKQFMEVIRTNARRMETLLQDVSDSNKLRAGTVRVTNKMDMFKNIIMMVDKNTRPFAEQLNRTLTFNIPSGLPILNTDGELLAKAFTKLVENALRYTRDGGNVSVHTSAEGSTITTQFKDDGIGMTPEELAQLGTIYFRSDNEYVRTYKGSGLGIPVAYGMIKLLGGIISVVSEVDKGTTFTVTIYGMT